MAEIEYGGLKVGGSKLLLVIPLVTTLGGALWGGFEFYKDYTDMKEKIQTYVAPDLSGFDKRIALIDGQFSSLKKEDIAMQEVIRTEVNSLKESNGNLKSDVHDVKMELKNDITKFFKNLDKQEERNRNNVGIVRGIINSFEIRIDNKIDKLDDKIDKLEENLDLRIKKALENPLSAMNK